MLVSVLRQLDPFLVGIASNWLFAALVPDNVWSFISRTILAILFFISSLVSQKLAKYYGYH